MHAARSRRWWVLIGSALLAVVPAARLAAQVPPSRYAGPPAARTPAARTPAETPPAGGLKAPLPDHPHLPIEIASRPMIERLAVALLRPRRLLVEDDGRVTVADWGAGTVIEVGLDGQVTFLAEGLNEPAGLARDPLGALYVSTHAAGGAGAGAVFRIAPGDDPVPFVDGLTGPTDIAFGPDGSLYVAAFHENTVLRVSPGGGTVSLAASVAAPAALAFDAAGLLYVASSTEGALFRISPMGAGAVELVTRDLHVPSDLAFDPQGHLIVADYGTQELCYVDPFGQPRRFAVVPAGTIAIDFDAEGNLLFVNWDGHYLMKVTTHLTLPCPHCGQPIPVRLREPKPLPEVSPDEPPRPMI